MPPARLTLPAAIDGLGGHFRSYSIEPPSPTRGMVMQLERSANEPLHRVGLCRGRWQDNAILARVSV